MFGYIDEITPKRLPQSTTALIATVATLHDANSRLVRAEHRIDASLSDMRIRIENAITSSDAILLQAIGMVASRLRNAACDACAALGKRSTLACEVLDAVIDALDSLVLLADWCDLSASGLPVFPAKHALATMSALEPLLDTSTDLPPYTAFIATANMHAYAIDIPRAARVSTGLCLAACIANGPCCTGYAAASFWHPKNQLWVSCRDEANELVPIGETELALQFHQAGSCLRVGMAAVRSAVPVCCALFYRSAHNLLPLAIEHLCACALLTFSLVFFAMLCFELGNPLLMLFKPNCASCSPEVEVIPVSTGVLRAAFKFEDELLLGPIEMHVSISDAFLPASPFILPSWGSLSCTHTRTVLLPFRDGRHKVRKLGNIQGNILF